MTEFQLAFSTVDYNENYFTGAPEAFVNETVDTGVLPGTYRVTESGGLELVTLAAADDTGPDAGEFPLERS